MKCSYHWLNEFVDLTNKTPKELAHALTMSGSIVESVTETGQGLTNIVIGKITAVEKHPDADRLFVCTVDVGDGSPRTIVTAATNVFAGAVIPVALDGAVLHGGKKIKTGKMRGIESQGMLCSPDELGLDEHDQPGACMDGILILDGSFAIGSNAVEALLLRDFVLELEITNNRPDCLSIIGLAREAAAALRLPLKDGTTLRPAEPDGQTGGAAPITVTVEDSALCPRYSAAVVENVRIGPSPVWMRRRLRVCGIRPINNIVDITNYVLLETGQPMHAFDRDRVKGDTITVRAARPGEVLVTLDGKERTLDPSMLVIADAEGAAAVAGVMGGASSEVTEKTTSVVFESANFNGPSVRRTALSLAMRTDSSTRFEKGLDRTATARALARACELVSQLGAGDPLPGLTDVWAPHPPRPAIPFTHKQINGLLGAEIDGIDGLLESLGFTVKDGAATAPSWRRDVTIWQDLAEEAARLYGYGNIPVTLPASKNQGWLTREQTQRARLHEICVSLGFCEMLTYSFISPSELKCTSKAKVIRNPLGEEHSVMRTCLRPSFLQALSSNTAVRNPEARLYELSKVYIDGGGQLPLEQTRLILGGYGGSMEYFTLKGAVETLFDRFIRREVVFTRAQDESELHPGRAARISIDGNDLGTVGELHPSLGYPAGAAVCELNADALLGFARPDAVFKQLPRFPAISRDLALVCPEEVTHAAVTDVIRKAGGALLEDCRLFDVYKEKNSLAYRLTFRAPDRTLTDEEADAAIKRVLKKLQDGLKITLRS
jgi:phenylalanyl-tRNA synthetase beta chain